MAANLLTLEPERPFQIIQTAINQKTAIPLAPDKLASSTATTKPTIVINISSLTFLMISTFQIN